MAFEEQLPQWENEGTQPPQSKRVEGWLPNEKPPASWFNWLFGRTYRVLKEFQEKAAEKVDVQQAQATADSAVAAAADAQQTADDAATAAANAQSDIDAHLNDNERHVTQAEKNTWNNKISKSGDTMTGDLTINKSVPLLELIHEATGTSVEGGLIMRNFEQNIWRVGATSTLGHFYIDSFTGNINLRSASYRYGLRGPNADVFIIVHDAHPEGSIPATVGSLCLRIDSGSHAKLYVKDSGTGNTGWVEVLTS